MGFSRTEIVSFVLGLLAGGSIVGIIFDFSTTNTKVTLITNTQDPVIITNETKVTSIETLSNEGMIGPLDTSWISPGKVLVGNIGVGMSADYFINIHNGGSILTSYSIVPSEATILPKGTLAMQSSFLKAQTNIVYVSNKETLKVPLTLTIPSGIKLLKSLYEIWVYVQERAQVGVVKVKPYQRWIVEVTR